MKYTPKILKGNVNVSKKSALKDFFILLGGLFAITVGVYIVLGFAVDFIVPKLPLKTEKILEKAHSHFYKYASGDAEEQEIKVQKLLDKLIKQLSDEAKQDYKVHIVPNSKSNALALAGGHIVVFSGLLDEIESENELSMILAHELGHFANRDHLRGLGRGLVLFTISIAILGADNPATNFLKNSLTNVQMKYSQHQERQADLFALELLEKRYGHVGGTVDFFKKLKEKEKMGRFFYFFSTHPYCEDRITAIKEHIRREGYTEKEKIPLNFSNL